MKRTRKQQRQDSKGHYRGLAERSPAADAIKDFQRPPYQAGDMIRAQGEQIPDGAGDTR